MADKTKTSIHFTADDTRRLRWLRKHFGGIGQGSVVTMALKALQEREKAYMAVQRISSIADSTMGGAGKPVQFGGQEVTDS
jgi:hypothetical protein